MNLIVTGAFVPDPKEVLTGDLYLDEEGELHMVIQSVKCGFFATVSLATGKTYNDTCKTPEAACEGLTFFRRHAVIHILPKE